jgi:phage/plasmid-associated DNA primase
LGDKTEKQAAHERIKARDAAKEMYKQQNHIDKEAALKVAQDKRAKKFKKALKKAGVTKQDGDAIASASSDFLKDPTTGDPVPADEKGKKKIPRVLSEALLNCNIEATTEGDRESVQGFQTQSQYVWRPVLGASARRLHVST